VTQNLRLQAALEHARNGRAVLPVYWSTGGRCACGRADCHSPAKHPIPELVPRGVKQATTSRVVIRAWWVYAPLANPALATGEVSGVVVLDVDGDHGGFDSLRQLEQHHEPLPLTQRVRTGSGEHLYFRHPRTYLKNTAGKLGAGLDVRCCGGYAVTVGAVLTVLAAFMHGRPAADQTRWPWPTRRPGCWAGSRHPTLDHSSRRGHHIVAMPRRRSRQKNDNSCKHRSGSATRD